MTSPKNNEVEVLAVQRRRRWTASEKLAMVRETYEPGMSVSLVARRHGVNPNQLFHWRRLEKDGALTAVGAGEAVVPATELEAARRQIRELQRLLGVRSPGRSALECGNNGPREPATGAIDVVVVDGLTTRPCLLS